MEALAKREQIADIIKGIANLLPRQGTAAPFGPCFAFGELDPQKLVHQRAVADGISQADQACGDLQIKQISWPMLRIQIAKPYLFPRRVNKFPPSWVDDE